MRVKFNCGKNKPPSERDLPGGSNVAGFYHADYWPVTRNTSPDALSIAFLLILLLPLANKTLKA
jgi:hypothetical protein